MLDDAPLYVFADANASCGPQDGQHVFASDGPKTPNTEDFRLLLQEHDLCLPSTSEVHEGSHETWWSPDGTKTARIDYVAIPCSHLTHCTMSTVLNDFDMGQTYDHVPVGLELSWTVMSAQQTGRSSSMLQKYDRSNISGKPMFEEIQTASWSTDIETHVKDFNQQIHTDLGRHCADRSNAAKKIYMTEEMWTLRKLKLNSRKHLKQLNKEAHLATLRGCFTAWKTGCSAEDFGTQRDSDKCKQLKLLVNHHLASRRLKQLLRHSKMASLQQAFDSMPNKVSSSHVLQVIKEHWGPAHQSQEDSTKAIADC